VSDCMLAGEQGAHGQLFLAPPFIGFKSKSLLRKTLKVCIEISDVMRCQEGMGAPVELHMKGAQSLRVVCLRAHTKLQSSVGLVADGRVLRFQEFADAQVVDMVRAAVARNRAQDSLLVKEVVRATLL
jgi:hypothetical protein